MVSCRCACVSYTQTVYFVYIYTNTVNDTVMFIYTTIFLFTAENFILPGSMNLSFLLLLEVNKSLLLVLCVGRPLISSQGGLAGAGFDVRTVLNVV